MNDIDLDSGIPDPADESRRTFGGPTEQAEGVVRKLFLAGIGAAAVAYDTAEQSFDRFVDRGQEARQDWRNRTGEVRRQRAETRERARGYFRGAMDVFLDTLNVPSKGDVDTINVKLNILSRKLDDIQLSQAESMTESAGLDEEAGTVPPQTSTELGT